MYSGGFEAGALRLREPKGRLLLFVSGDNAQLEAAQALLNAGSEANIYFFGDLDFFCIADFIGYSPRFSGRASVSRHKGLNRNSGMPLSIGSRKMRSPRIA